MEAILAIIIEYAAMWAPALVAVLGIVATVIGAISKCRDAIIELRNDTTISSMGAKLDALARENAELVRCNKLLLDQITKIQGYADAKSKEV